MIQAVPLFESLESRRLLAFNPTGQEQEMLELVNRFRMDPGPELDRILNQHNPDVEEAMASFNVNMATLRAQWEQLRPAQPLAWNPELYAAARAHTLKLIEADEQSHQVEGELDLRDRVDGLGYDPYSYLGENVFAYAQSVFHTHAALAIDWGLSPTGIQSPPYHRQNLMDTAEIPVPNREIGIAVIKTPAGQRETGPLIITQDFGAPLEPGDAYVLGTVRADLKPNGLYNAGEGLGGVSIRVTGGGKTYRLKTMSAGGYQIQVPPGTYTVVAAGAGLARTVRRNVVVTDSNVKQDFVAASETSRPKAKLGAAAQASRRGNFYLFTVTYTDNSALRRATVSTADVEVSSSNGYRALAALVSRAPGENAATLQATYKIKAPGGRWDPSDNGTYMVSVQAEAVKDIHGNAVAPAILGNLAITIPAKKPRGTARAALGATPLKPAAALTLAAARPRAALFSRTSLFGDNPEMLA